jgi:hypothetical protein
MEELKFIDSMQEEYEDKCKGCNNFSMCNKCMNGEKWAFIEEKGSEELENKIQDFFDRWMEDSEYNQAVMPNFYCASLEDCKNIARHFAKWQEEKMIKEAVDAQYRNIFGEVLLAYNPRELGIGVKDKIKILVIKEK